LKGYDEPEILRYQLSQFGPISADAGQAAWQWLVTANTLMESAIPLDELLSGDVEKIISAAQNR
jgi:hypothetical protein